MNVKLEIIVLKIDKYIGVWYVVSLCVTLPSMHLNNNTMLNIVNYQ